MPPTLVNVSIVVSQLIAGFESSINCWIWVSTEATIPFGPGVGGGDRAGALLAA